MPSCLARRLGVAIWGAVALCAAGCGAAENPAQYLKELHSPNPYVRQAAARELGDMKERLAVAPLLELLTTDQPEDVRVEAIMALGKIEDAQATPRLVAQLESGSSQVRRRAAEALGRVGDKRAVEPLMDFIREAPSRGDKDVLAAIWALGNISDLKAIDLLLSLQASTDKYVAYNAGQALKRLGQ